MLHSEVVLCCSCPSCEASAARALQVGSDYSPPSNSRRAFLVAGAGLLLAGCAKAMNTTALPGPVWKPRDLGPLNEAVAAGPTTSALPGNVIPRAQWAQAAPYGPLLNPMLPVRNITVHHDGMDPFFATDQRSSADRLERIRLSHRNKGWADIGYHFAIDRDGRIWQGRTLNWQGAHVKDHNEGNIGIVTLGNFDRQTPTAPQIAALNKHITYLMNQYRVSLNNVKTHQEWAPTACPGASLQRYLAAVRKNRQLG